MAEMMTTKPTASSMAQQLFDEFFRSAPSEVDVAAIRQEWQAVKPPYFIENRQLPLPVWARRNFTDNGRQAWTTLRQEVSQNDPARPFCIYIHLPFCSRRCSFCDCYSFRLQRHRARHIEAYLALLTQEMRLWGQLDTLARRPVSTVHLGGGTPTFLGAAAFRRLTQNCREQFNTDPQTEWALESTTAELTDEMFSVLADLRFTRLHLGLQSLEDPVRRLINRQESTVVVLEKIARAVKMGWVVSVDLIFGLPGQTLAGLLADIHTLALAGVDGFSLYELQLSSRNRQFAEMYGLTSRNRLTDYFLFQAAARLLAALGYRKTLFNHFARERDTNLYFTFPARGR
jgi:coproporphyrinogen III oxidase-like Fe-S oxidoreductase